VDTGFAVWDSSLKKFLSVESVTFWDCVEWFDGRSSVKVYIEAPHENRPVFSKNKQESHKATLKIAQNIGENKCMAKLLIEYLERNFIDYNTVKPTKTKMDAVTFKRLSGWEARTNSHGRDAGRLVMGR